MSKTSQTSFPKHCHICGRRLWGRGWSYAPDSMLDDQAIVVCRHCYETAAVTCVAYRS